MGLLDLLPTSNFGLDGATPANIPSANPGSTLHNISSITNDPKLVGEMTLNASYPAPSRLDISGVPPTVSPTGQKLPYIKNLPR